MRTSGRLQQVWMLAATAFLVARREFVTRVRTRVFRIGTAVLVLLLIAGTLIQANLVSKVSVTTVGFTASTRVLAQPLKAAAAADGLPVSIQNIANQSQGTGEVRDGKLDVLITGAPRAPQVVVQDQLDATLRAALTGVVKQEALVSQLAGQGLSPAAIRAVEAAVAGTSIQVRSLTPTNPKQKQQEVIGFIVGFTLYLALTLYGAFVVQGVIEEKASRVVELLLAAIRPGQLLLGKLAG